MRHAISLIAITVGVWGTKLAAQSIIRPHPLLTQQPSFQHRFFERTPLSGVPFKVDTLGISTYTCPMPVVRTDSANSDSMPVARGLGKAEPMPVARSGCANPLDRHR